MTNFSMFDDRRRTKNRRTQNLPMPQGFNRRAGSRRNGQQFQSKKSWWLEVGFADELVSAQSLKDQQPEQHTNESSSETNITKNQDASNDS